MTKRQRAEHKLGNAKRAWELGVKSFKGVGFRNTQTGRALMVRVNRWSKRLNP